jgi:hypothetical protein
MPIAQRLCVVFALIAAFAAGARAQGTDLPTAPTRPAGQIAPHRFWDSENDWLFGGIAASRTLDYFSTLNMRRRGRDEILLNNDVVDNHAAFGTIEVAAAGVSIGASYLFHRHGHHRLERWTSIVHFSVTTVGAARNYSLVTRHYTIIGPPIPGAPR